MLIFGLLIAGMLFLGGTYLAEPLPFITAATLAFTVALQYSINRCSEVGVVNLHIHKDNAVFGQDALAFSRGPKEVSYSVQTETSAVKQ